MSVHSMKDTTRTRVCKHALDRLGGQRATPRRSVHAGCLEGLATWGSTDKLIATWLTLLLGLSSRRAVVDEPLIPAFGTYMYRLPLSDMGIPIQRGEYSRRRATYITTYLKLAAVFPTGILAKNCQRSSGSVFQSHETTPRRPTPSPTTNSNSSMSNSS